LWYVSTSVVTARLAVAPPLPEPLELLVELPLLPEPLELLAELPLLLEPLELLPPLLLPVLLLALVPVLSLLVLLALSPAVFDPDVAPVSVLSLPPPQPINNRVII